jgi:hypothetical protein
MPFQIKKYFLNNTPLILPSFIFCALYLFNNNSLSGQCISLKWVDPELNIHRGFALSGLDGAKYVYFNSAYKTNKVIQVDFLDQYSKHIHRIQKYDDNGFLIFEMKYSSRGNKELHHFTYQANHYTVIDSIIHVVFHPVIDYDKRIVIEPIKTDTFVQIQKKVFNSNYQVTIEYDKFLTPYNYISFPYAPNFFDTAYYHYNECGNCYRRTVYLNGGAVKAEDDYEYNYSDYYENDNICYQITILQKGQPFYPERWKLNKEKQFIEITDSPIKISVEYKNNKIKRYIKTESGFSTQGNKTAITAFVYKYDRRGFISKVRINYAGYFEDMKSETIKTYRNGLFKMNTFGQLLRYTYKN